MQHLHKEMTYQDAVIGAERYISAGKLGKADIFISRYRGDLFLVKDFSGRASWERNSIGRLLIRREYRAYRGLAGIEGLPGRFQRLSPFCLAIEYLAGRDFSHVERQEVQPGTLRELADIIHALHVRGWVHLDLHRRKNILLVDGKVFVVDLASAFHTAAVPVIGSLLTKAAGIADRLALVKFKAIFAPEMLTPGEQRLSKIRNIFLRTSWSEQTTAVGKERDLPQRPPAREGRRFETSQAKENVPRRSRTLQEAFANKLTKITPSTVLAGLAGIALYWFARGKDLKTLWLVPGASLALSGVWLRLWAAGHLRKNWQITSSGPYAYVKNPLYIGTLLICTGFGAMAMNTWIIAAGLAWFVLLYAPYKKKRESEKLSARFGDAWKSYDRSVPDYVPRLTPYPDRRRDNWSWKTVRENSEHETAAAVLLGIIALLALYFR